MGVLDVFRTSDSTIIRQSLRDEFRRVSPIGGLSCFSSSKSNKVPSFCLAVGTERSRRAAAHPRKVPAARVTTT